MKKLFFVFAFALFGNLAFSQSIIEREFSQYLEQDNVTHVFVSGKMFDMAATVASGIDDEEISEITEFAEKIESFTLIKVPAPVDALSEYKKGISSISGDYEELIRVRDQDTRFTLLVSEEDNVVFEVIGLGAVDQEFIAFSLVGEMDLNKISEFISKMDNKSLAPLQRMSNYSPTDVKVYPNPATSNAELTVEIPEELVGGNITLYSSTGQKIKSSQGDAQSVTIKTNNLSEGNYFIEIEKDGVTIKKQVIILQ